MKRRALLSGFGATMVAGFAGCTSGFGSGTASDPYADEDPLYPDDRSVPAASSTHHLFVENVDDRRYPLTVTVVRSSDDALVWRAAHDTPDGRGFEIPDLFVEGRSYRLVADVDGGARASTERNMEPCPNGGGSRNLNIRIEDGAITFVQDGCDEILAGTLVPVGSHGSFRIEATE